MEENEKPKFVRDLMTVGVETCTPETPVVELAGRFLQKELEEVVVLEEGNALGVIGQVELIRAYTRLDVADLKAEDILREGVPQVPPEIPLTAAAQVMLDQGVRALFLMHASAGIEYPAAVITFRHLLRHLAGDDLNDLGIKAARRSPLETFIQKREAARRSNRGGN